MKKYCIYVHINKINGLKYVGQTSLQPEERWGKNGIGYSKQYFYNAIQKYGWDNFDHIILERNLSSDEADKREQFWISYYNSIKPNGYNISLGGQGVALETREKMKQGWTQKRRDEKSQLMIFLNQSLDRTGSNNSMYGACRKGATAGNKRKVQCLETKTIFETVADASRWWNNGKDSLKSHIAQQIQGKRKSCGKHPITKEKLHWRYID